MVKFTSLRSSKRTKVLAWILPVYLVVFLFYAAFGTSENRKIRRERDLQPSVDTWTSDRDLVSQQRHLLSIDPLKKNCTPAAIEEFPPDIFNQSQRTEGGVIIHFLISIYLFYALAIICDDYFVPSLECLCNKLELPTDIAGATFMAMGTSAPELFTSVIGAFITEGDIGVGTIVGSAVFNILAVLSVCGLLAGINGVVPLDWWPLTRDSLAYVVTVVALILIITDQRVTWWEGAIMLGLYVLYIAMMFFNTRLQNLAIRVVDACQSGRKRHLIVESVPSSEQCPLMSDGDAGGDRYGSKMGNGHVPDHENGHCRGGGGSEDNGYSVPIKDVDNDDDDDCGDEDSIWSMPYHGSFKQIAWVVMWPMNLLFHLTIPNCKRKEWKSWYMGTFFMSIFYIGSLSYVIAWMVTIIGYTLGVPDTVMGLTFLAAGTSVPEAISSVLVCRQGYGNMAVSNIIGSNIFDILFCLGLPWVIKAAAFSGAAKSVIINSAGIEYSSISLLSTVVFLYVAVIVNKWKLDKRLGISCLVMYVAFLVVSNLFEMNVFGTVNLPTCRSH